MRSVVIMLLIGVFALVGLAPAPSGELRQSGPGQLKAASLPSASPALTEAPTLVFPLEGAALGDFGAGLLWTNPAGTTQNQLQVTPANNDGPGVNLIFNADTSYFIPPPPEWYGLLPDMTYTWRVRATDKATAVDESSPEWGPWSPERTFHTPTASASTLTLTSPPEGAVATSARPILQWSETHSRVFYYEVQLSKDSAFTTDPATATAAVYGELRHGALTTPVNSYRVPDSITLEEGATYYWRVRPRIQGDGTPVEWSPTFSFTVSVAPPLADLPEGEIAGGTLELEQVNIEAGTTVRAIGATTLVVNGPVTIEGDLVSETADLTILAQGDITVSGSIDTAAAGPASGKNGGSITLQSSGDVTISGLLTTGAGGTAPATVQRLSRSGRVRSNTATPAGSGGHIRVETDVGITIAPGATITTGSGQPGAAATAMGASPLDDLEAIAGNGGSGGDIVLRGASITLPDSGIVFILGDGGDGGTATYAGIINDDGQTSGGRAVGGAGGDGGRPRFTPEAPEDQLAPLVSGGRGGNGGDATGSLVTVASSAVASSRVLEAKQHGKHNKADGGKGGDGHAGSGDGGDADAPPGGNGVGGDSGGHSIAKGGHGGLASGRNSTGGRGGDATSNRGGYGSHGPRGGEAGHSYATGGNARKGRGGRGGNATTGDGGFGGNGLQCPRGEGGQGGNSVPIGGKGFPGGNAKSGTSGKGGTGANCCNPPQKGGEGGQGGWNAAYGGNGLSGVVGGDGGKAEAGVAGDGGNGGEGDPPGKGGLLLSHIARGGRPGKGLDGSFGKKGAEMKRAPGNQGRSGLTCSGETPTPTVTLTPTATATSTPTPTPTPPSAAPPQTPTPTAIGTATPTLTATSTPTSAPTAMATLTATPTLTATSTTPSTPTATAAATPTATPVNGVNYLEGLSLDVSATDENHNTHYEVHFSDPMLEAERPLHYSYDWELIFNGSDCLGGYIYESIVHYRALFSHRDCAHTAIEEISVSVTSLRDFQSVTLRGPAVGAGTITP